MKPFSFFHFHETRYIHLSPRTCQGCWKCVEVCPKGVLAGRDRLHHGHVRIKEPEACTGCKKCVRVCEFGALEYIYIPRPSHSAHLHVPEDN
jgi:NAD-dependent dihydropyrimidine dehydrogenase PreA subunit